MKKKLTMVDVINETVAFYSEDTDRRSILRKGQFDSGRCLYNGPDGRKCAFARYVKGDVDKKHEGNSATTLLRRGVQLKDEVAHITKKNFWAKLQLLHDNSCYWNDKGLTEEGQNMVDEMIREYTE